MRSSAGNGNGKKFKLHLCISKIDLICIREEIFYIMNVLNFMNLESRTVIPEGKLEYKIKIVISVFYHSAKTRRRNQIIMIIFFLYFENYDVNNLS